MARTAANQAPVLNEGEKPRYRVLEGSFQTGGPKSQILNPGDVVAMWGEPNMNLEPLNEAALEKMEAFLEDRNVKSAEFTKRLRDEKGVYVKQEVYKQRYFAEEADAMPKSSGDVGKLLGSAEDPSDCEVVFQGPPPGTVGSAQPGAVTGLVHNA